MNESHLWLVELTGEKHLSLSIGYRKIFCVDTDIDTGNKKN